MSSELPPGWKEMKTPDGKVRKPGGGEALLGRRAPESHPLPPTANPPRLAALARRSTTGTSIRRRLVRARGGGPGWGVGAAPRLCFVHHLSRRVHLSPQCGRGPSRRSRQLPPRLPRRLQASCRRAGLSSRRQKGRCAVSPTPRSLLAPPARSLALNFHAISPSSPRPHPKGVLRE